jgi:transposase
LSNLKISNLNLYETCAKEYLTNEQISCKFAENLFDNLMINFKKDRFKNVKYVIRKKGLIIIFLSFKRFIFIIPMMVEIVKIIKLVKKEKEILPKITVIKCKAFLKAYEQNLDMEINLEDFIETMKNCQTVEAIRKYMSIECGICSLKQPMNKVM